MADLNEEHKLYILEQLATMRSPAQIIKSLAENFSVRATYQQISAYNPDNAAGARLSDEHKELFWRLRESFLNDRTRIAITHKNYRLQRLQDLLDDPKTGTSSRAVLAVLKLYEEIEGGVYQRQKQDDGGAAAGLKTLRDYLGIKVEPTPSGGSDGE